MSDTTVGAHDLPADADRVRRVELVISAVLRIGVLTSLLVIVAGTVVTFIHHPHYLSSNHDLVRLTQPGAEFPHSVPAVIRGLEHSQGRAIVMAGILLLIATPVLRVAVSILASSTSGTGSSW